MLRKPSRRPSMSSVVVFPRQVGHAPEKQDEPRRMAARVNGTVTPSLFDRHPADGRGQDEVHVQRPAVFPE